MHLSKQIAKHMYDVHFGGNWTTIHVQEVLENVTYQQAIFQVKDFNTIAHLTYHINYYVSEVMHVLKGNELQASDKVSFHLPKDFNSKDWGTLKQKTLTDAKQFSKLISEIAPDKWDTYFSHKKYGSYFRNMVGILEHTHYHLGQIVLIKKLSEQD